MLDVAVLDAVRSHVGPWRWQEHEHLPEGLIYDIDDGQLVMAPAPGTWHNRAARRLAEALEQGCGPEWWADAPGAVLLGASYREPDAIVARPVLTSEVRPRDPSEVLLVAEVISPTSGPRDRRTKLHDYASVGIAHCWVVEIEPVPALTAYALRGGAYVELATVRGDDTYEATDPFPVRVTPNALLT